MISYLKYLQNAIWGIFLSPNTGHAKCANKVMTLLAALGQWQVAVGVNYLVSSLVGYDPEGWSVLSHRGSQRDCATMAYSNNLISSSLFWAFLLPFLTSWSHFPNKLFTLKSLFQSRHLVWSNLRHCILTLPSVLIEIHVNTPKEIWGCKVVYSGNINHESFRLQTHLYPSKHK